jgi:hypothetical protein
LTYPVVEEGDHAIDIHGFTSVELEILEVGNNLFGVGRGPLFKGFDPLGVIFPELSLDGLHVALEIAQIALLVEYGGLESEGVDNVVNLGGSFFKSLILLLSRGVGTCPGSVIDSGTRFENPQYQCRHQHQP